MTTSALDGLLYIYNGHETARWNFFDAIGSDALAPAGIGNAVVVSYSFLSAVPAYDSEPGFRAFDAQQKDAARSVLAKFSEVADISFVQKAGVGQITFGNSSQNLNVAGYAYAPSFGYSFSGSGDILSVTASSKGGDVWINGDIDWTAADWLAGGSGYGTLLHEVGHALGLKHPFEGPTVLAPQLDNAAHTVMAYSPAPNSVILSVQGTQASYSWSTTWLEPSTLMLLDIEALQHLYGANTATRSGDNVYSWGARAELLETIWDGGGRDHINCANQVYDCVIDLREGAFSSIGWRKTEAQIRSGLDIPSWFAGALPEDIYDGSNNLAIAKGAVIENATGGAGRDRITGNVSANALAGGAGNDTL